MPEIVDCVIGFNEVDMLMLRVAELTNVVDSFVVVESNKTHTGADKPILLGEAVSELRQAGYDIIHYVIDDMPGAFGSALELGWIVENLQRNCILRPLSLMGLADDAIIMVSDIDEIPRPECVAELPALLDNPRNIAIFEMVMKKYFVNNNTNTHHNNTPWLGTVACCYGLLKFIMPQGARIGDPISPRSACVNLGYARELYPYERRVPNGGWHFSSMGGMEALALKMQSIVERTCANTEMVPKSTRLGKHNHRQFRESNAEAISKFLADYTPELTNVRAPTFKDVAELDIPVVMKMFPHQFEFLFYLADPLDDTTGESLDELSPKAQLPFTGALTDRLRTALERVFVDDKIGEDVGGAESKAPATSVEAAHAAGGTVVTIPVTRDTGDRKMSELFFDLKPVRTLHSLEADRWLGRPGRAFWCEWDHPGETPRSFASIVSQLEHEHWPRFIKPGSTIVDVGGHSGDTAVPMGLFVYDQVNNRQGKVIVVEPNPEVLKVMTINLAMNAHIADFKIMPCAITEHDVDEIELSDHGNAHCNGGVIENTHYSEECTDKIAAASVNRYKARGVTLLTLLRECGVEDFSTVSFIKTDCEGYDKEILRGSAEFIRTYQPTLFVEWFAWFSPTDDADLFKAVDELDYVAYDPTTLERATLNHRISDILCLPKSWTARL